MNLDGTHGRTAECSKTYRHGCRWYSLEGLAEKRAKVRSDLGPLISAFEPSPPFSLSLTTMLKSNSPKWHYRYGYWCLLFISFSLFSLSSGCVVFYFLWAFSPVALSDSLQMDVVSAFQSGTSFQGALRRQASNSSQQQHDVTNVSSPTHVAFSTTTATAANTASATVGCECVFSSSAWDFNLLCSSNIFLLHSPLT